MARTSYASKPTPHEQAIIDGAERFSAYIFVSRSIKRTVPCDTKPEAERTAQMLANQYRKPAIIYAIKGGLQAFLKTVPPARAG